MDPHSFYADPDPAVFLNANADPGLGRYWFFKDLYLVEFLPMLFRYSQVTWQRSFLVRG